MAGLPWPLVRGGPRHDDDADSAEGWPVAGPVARARGLSRSPILLSVVGALLLGSLMLLLAGGNPIEAYAAMVTGAFGPTQWRNTLIVAVPWWGWPWPSPSRCAPEWSTWGRGQIVLGGITAAVIAATVDLPMPLSLLVALGAGALAGGLLGTVPALLENRLAVPLAGELVADLVPGGRVRLLPGAVPVARPGTGLPQTRVFDEAYRMPMVYGVGLSTVVLVVVIALVVQVDSRTPFGTRCA
jgi:simple sugar transport system permease protein